MRAKVVDQVQVTPVLYAGPHLPESLLGHLDQLLSAQAEVVALICAEHLLEDVLVIRRVLLSLRTVNKPLDLRVGKNNSHPHAIKMTEPHIHLYILPLLSTDGKTLIKKDTHPLVDFRIASAAVGDSVLDYSACERAAAFQLTQLLINLHQLKRMEGKRMMWNNLRHKHLSCFPPR